MCFCVHLELSQSFHCKLSFLSFFPVIFFSHGTWREELLRRILMLKLSGNTNSVFLTFLLLGTRMEEVDWKTFCWTTACLVGFFFRSSCIIVPGVVIAIRRKSRLKSGIACLAVQSVEACTLMMIICVGKWAACKSHLPCNGAYTGNPPME